MEKHDALVNEDEPLEEVMEWILNVSSGAYEGQVKSNVQVTLINAFVSVDIEITDTALINLVPFTIVPYMIETSTVIIHKLDHIVSIHENI